MKPMSAEDRAKLPSGQGDSLREFDESTIVRLSGMPGLKLYDPETSQCLQHREDWPSFSNVRHPRVSLLITAYNKLGYTFNCLQSVRRACSDYDGKYEIIVIDDASTDQTADLLSGIRGLNVVSLTKNMGFVKSSNIAARRAKGEYVVLLNNDTIVTSGWLEFLLRTFEDHRKVGAVGSKLIYPSGLLQEAGATVWSNGSTWNYGRLDDPDRPEYQYVRDVDYCSATSLIVNRRFVRRLGIFDEQFRPGSYEDVDLCFYVRNKGARVLYQPESAVIHFEGATFGRGTSSSIEKYQLIDRGKFRKKWYRALQGRYPARRVFADPMSALLSVYYSREDLKKSFPEVQDGDLARLLNWAKATVTQKNDSYPSLASFEYWYRTNLLSELPSIRDSLSKSEEERKTLTDQVQTLSSELTSTHHSLSKSEEERKTLTDQVQTLSSELTSTHHSLSKSEEERDELRSNLGSLRQENKALTTRVQDLLDSPSWRVTAPLRLVGSALHASRHARLPAESVQSEDIIASSSPDDLAACTIVAKNYLSHARVLTDSFLKYHPASSVFVLLVDEMDGYFDPDAERFRLVRFEELGIEKPATFRFKYSVLELSTAVKPFFLEYLFRRFGLRKAVYLDPDILVTDTLHELSKLLDRHDVILTPHILEPIDDDRRPSQLDILLAGTYNLGFIAISNTENTASFLKWWQGRVYDYCMMDPLKGFHVDQKWIELALGFFDRVLVLRDPCYNVAYWNIGTRRLTVTGGRYFVRDKPLRFFHFSGVEPDNLGQISRHQNRFTLRDRPEYTSLFNTYRDLLHLNGYQTVRRWPYAYDYFDNGVRIPEIARKTYRESTELQHRYLDPFLTRGGETYFEWLNASAESTSASPHITRLWNEIYKLRNDVRRAYPDLFGSDRWGFIGWVINTGWKEHSVDKAFVPEVYFSASKPAGREIPPGASHQLSAILRSSRQVIANEGISSFLRQFGVKIRRREFRIIQPSFDVAKASFPRLSDIQLDSKIDSASPVEKPSSVTVQKQIPLPFGVNMAGYFTGLFGNATTSRAFAEALKLGGVAYVLNKEVGTVHGERHHVSGPFSTDNPYAVNLIHMNADMAEGFFRSRGPSYSEGRYNIGIWYWELSKFPARWLPAFRLYDEIWATSAFIVESLSPVSPIPIVKMRQPLIINDSVVDRMSRSKLGIEEDDRAFLFTFDFMSVFERKNPLGLVNAFERAFGRDDKAVLILHHINSEFNPPAAKLLEKASEKINVKIVEGHLSEQEYLSLVAACDCYVSLHRSEGLGLTMAEAMYLGKPVIATAYSGNMEFMNLNNSLLVKYDLVELDRNYGPYDKGNVWAEPDVGHAAELMREVYENRDKAKAIGERGCGDIREHMNPALVSQEMRLRLERIYEELVRDL
jgi:GT2 family glycosyltransferase/glycosyltransferase involved in cell wall biosynthesis